MSILKRLFRRGPRLTFHPLTNSAQLPTYATAGAAGLDLYADEDVVVPFLKRELVKTNIAVDLPAGIEAQVRARSGLALKKGIAVLNAPGTIDPDYTGGIGVILFNTDMEDFVVRRGDRIAQLVIAPFVRVQPAWAKNLADESLLAGRVTARGAGGFGSTGTGALAAGGLAMASLAPAAAPTWFEGDPALMDGFDRPFVYRIDGSREFLDGKPSKRQVEDTRIARLVQSSIDQEIAFQSKPGGPLHHS